MADQYVNTASVATLSADISAAATSVSLSSFTGFPSTFPYWAMIAKGTASAELVQVTAAAGSTLTIVRGQGGTVAASHVTADKFEHVAPAKVFQDSANHVEATSGVHGATGSIVGTSGVQTVTDKTYRGAHTHSYTDANPSGVSAAFKVNADSAKASDGYVHDNTAADVNRKAFLGQQAGVDRFAVFNDGTVKITPASGATRPGLQLDDDLDVNGPADISGALTVGGALAVTGASTLTGDLVANAVVRVGKAGTNAGTVYAVAGNFDAIAVGGTQVMPHAVPNVQVFTASGTWTKPAVALWVAIGAQAAGGGGAGAVATGAGASACGTGGQGGQWCWSILPASSLGATEAVTVGAAGTVGAGVAGGAGGNSSVGTHVVAVGGAGGAVSVSSATGGGVNGPVDAQVGTGQIKRSGGHGGAAIRVESGGLHTSGGEGGDSHLGSGGGRCTGGGQTGQAASGFGGGGGGASNGPSQVARTGGAATAGAVVVITYFAG